MKTRDTADELKNFGAFWSHFGEGENQFRQCLRSQFRSSLELKTYHQQQQQQQQQESNQQQNHQGTARRRTPSLPPINTNYEYIVQEDEGREGDTSGYASDNAANEYPIGETWTKQNGNWPLPNFSSRKTPESVSSCSGGREEQRARWGDRGVGVGHLWAASPHLPQAPLPQIDRATPSWLHRGLMQEPAQVLVISHEDSYSNNQDMSRSCETLVSAEEFHRSYLRGQNTPIDPHSLAEREKKRQKALEQQNAIKQQLEEKERKKREEQERRLREERIEEERLRRHQELEIQRLEEEQRRAKEKEEKEERIAKAMREAIELAERTAREEKAKARRKHISERRPPTPRPTVKTITVSSPSAASDDSSSLLGERIEKNPPPPSPPPPPSTKLSETTSVILLAPAAASTPQKTATSPSRLSPLPSAITPLTLAIEELALEPGEIEVSRLGVLASPAGRVLTPSKFRSNVKREQATQTEQSSNKSRRERRSLRLEDRPKWGVNIPMTQYVKASDRDPHRRATRSRGRQQPDTEDSRSPSPLNNSKCSFSSFSPINRSVNGSNRVQSRTTRGVGTPRVIQVLPHGGQVRKSSASRRYLTIKG
uniref:CCDC66 domain-containing protein n=1 Tax=Rhodnius prolixus TaxID=13249 RepID=T1H874_RHOPR